MHLDISFLFFENKRSFGDGCKTIDENGQVGDGLKVSKIDPIYVCKSFYLIISTSVFLTFGYITR